MEVFSKIPYERTNYEKVTEVLHECIEKIRTADSYDIMKKAYLAWNDCENSFETMNTIASVRNTCHMDDKYYEDEMRYIHSETPKLAVELNDLYRAVLDSRFLDEFQNDFDPVVVKRMEAAIRLANSSIIEDKIRESELKQQYSRISGECTTDFRGEKCNFYGLLKHMESTDRQTRKEAFEAWSAMYESISSQLDKIYDELVHLRVKMAKKLGFEDPLEMLYIQRGRFDYDKNDAAAFRRQILEEVVPACVKLREDQRIRLRIDKLHYYDEALMRPEGNASPIGDRDYLVAQAKKMYRELSAETGQFFDFMTDYELFDLETRPNKRQGGYCTFMPDYKAPFIFSNFNGTSADVDVLTHEAGHAFAGYTASRSLARPEDASVFTEVAEIHSMTMEHWSYPWMELFFGDKAKEYCYDHLAVSLMVVPYMVSVDEFQHRMYENPDMTPMERRAVWKEIESIYMPWRDYDGNDFLEDGAFWMQKQHIFLYPMYYIDYALAQICAYQLYDRKKKDYDKAWADYLALCKAGGNHGYFELLRMAGIENPFEEGTVKRAVAGVLEELGI